MAVTQYVGARYVPLFADPLEWANTNTYEPLTIVQHEGNSYTSRQYVPAGIDISNEDYWALTGNYNAQIEQYRQEVQAFDSRITAAQNAADAAQTAAGTAQSAAETAQTAAKEAQSAASTAQRTAEAAQTAAGAAQSAAQAAQNAANGAQTTANSKAPIMHASSQATYGMGTASLYGHLKITDGDTAMGAQELQKLLKIVKGYRYQAIAATMRAEEFVLTAGDKVTLQSLYNNAAYVSKALGSLRIKTTATVNTALANNDVIIHGLPALATGTSGRGVMVGAYVVKADGTFSRVNLTVEPSGDISVNGAIDAGATLIIDINVATYTYYDDSTTPTEYAYAKTTQEVAQNAANAFKGFAGQFTYSNAISSRLDPAQKKSDCSGTIYLAYKQAGFDAFPTNASAVAGYGEIIAYADKGEPLDLSNALPGDVICYDTTSDNNNLINHVALVTGTNPIEVYEMGHANGDSGSTGPTVIADPENYVTGRIRYVVRYW